MGDKQMTVSPVSRPAPDANLLTFPNPGSSSKPQSHTHNSPSKTRPNESQVSFDRKELNQLLRVYGFAVARGEWRDYAIDMLRERAVFSVFRATSENPLYMIEKNPKLARRQGAYCITNASGQILKRGHDLKQVLRFFDKKPVLAAI